MQPAAPSDPDEASLSSSGMPTIMPGAYVYEKPSPIWELLVALFSLGLPRSGA